MEWKNAGGELSLCVLLVALVLQSDLDLGYFYSVPLRLNLLRVHTMKSGIFFFF